MINRHLSFALLACPGILLLWGCPDPSARFDYDGDGAEDAVDCDPEDPEVYPGNPQEDCSDGKDNDCDGYTDGEDVQCSPDDDGDGWTVLGGDRNDDDPHSWPGTTEICDGEDNDCDDIVPDDEIDLDGDGHMLCEDDCDDHEPTVFPGADEVCDGIDNSCDGNVPDDEIDSDGDGFAECEHDCDDTDPWIHPDADEACNGIDDDCDGDVPGDEADLDGDGFRPCEGDCNDADATAYPGATETCDGVDNDCDGALSDDESDLDGDGVSVCDGDCDDADPSVHPGTAELCNGGLDDDCDPATDETDVLDGDGFGLCDGDCDDTDNQVHPDSIELCDGIDNDCTGVVDDDCFDCDWMVPGDFTGIQDAINAADDGDTICLEAATFVGPIDFHGAEVTVVGLFGAASTIIDGNGVGPVVTFASGEDALTTLQRVTVTGGDGEDGGGIYLHQSSPLLLDLVIAGNQAETGAGLYMDMAAPTLERVDIIDNAAGPGWAYAWGGGAYILNYSQPVFVDVLIEDNVADAYSAYGGGLRVIDSWLTMSHCTIRDNVSDVGYPAAGGGGLSLYQADVTLDDVVIDGNRVSMVEHGAGISARYTDLTITNSRISGNDGADIGGGIWADDGSVLELTCVALIDNAANYGDGGALYLHESEALLDHVVVHGNSAQFHGGGLFSQDSILTLIDTSITANLASSDGGGLYAYQSNTVVVDHCNAWSNLPQDWWGIDDPTEVDGNISADPLFLDVTGADADDWDLHLGPTSDLVDAGTAATADPDGSPADIGLYSGPAGATFDLDHDGWYEWWQPGPYDAASYPALGWDCDDRDEDVGPGAGC